MLTMHRRRSIECSSVNRRRVRASNSVSFYLTTILVSMFAFTARSVESSGRLAVAAAATSTGSRQFRESPSASSASSAAASVGAGQRTATAAATAGTAVDPCYDGDGNARRCVPDFVNAAYGREIIASSTCGSPPIVPRCSQQQQQQQLGMKNTRPARDPSSGFGGQCFACDASSPQLRHPASYLTDNNNPNNLTCWTSEPFVDAERNVTLTLRLGKKYEASRSL